MHLLVIFIVIKHGLAIFEQEIRHDLKVMTFELFGFKAAHSCFNMNTNFLQFTFSWSIYVFSIEFVSGDCEGQSKEWISITQATMF